MTCDCKLTDTGSLLEQKNATFLVSYIRINFSSFSKFRNTIFGKFLSNRTNLKFEMRSANNFVNWSFHLERYLSSTCSLLGFCWCCLHLPEYVQRAQETLRTIANDLVK